MIRNAAHGDILPLMLAALGECNAERLARNFRIVEEHFVEVAHAIEQKRPGICGLDLDELGHHRRQFWLSRRINCSFHCRTVFCLVVITGGIVAAHGPSIANKPT